MKARHFLTVTELGHAKLEELTDDAVNIAKGEWDGWEPLDGKFIGLYFHARSTRTRTSFTVAATKLGAHTIAYGPNDFSTSPGEKLEDTARALSEYLDMLVVRTNDPMADIGALAAQGNMSIVNAMTEHEHPSQAIADLSVIKEHFGRLSGLHVLYLGEGNNTAEALVLAIAQIPGMRMTLVTPKGYGVPEATLEKAHKLAAASGAIIEEHHRVDRLPTSVDVVYTTRWNLGAPKLDWDWTSKFRPYAITAELMASVSKPQGTIFLHDLRAVRGFEVMAEVLDGPQSKATRLAYYKMASAMAVLNFCAGTSK